MKKTLFASSVAVIGLLVMASPAMAQMGDSDSYIRVATQRGGFKEVALRHTVSGLPPVNMPTNGNNQGAVIGPSSVGTELTGTLQGSALVTPRGGAILTPRQQVGQAVTKTIRRLG